MKVLLYFEGIKYISKSGVGRAFKHQQKALELAGVEFTTNPDDDYDILHINTVYANSQNIISKARKKGAKVIYHAHSTMEDFKNSFLLSNTTASVFKQILIYLYSKSDCIIAPTPYTKTLLESYGIDVPIYPVSNGIDLGKFKRDSEKSKRFREYFNVKDNEKVVVASGLWIKRKGITDFVEVAKMLPDIKFIWFGETPIYSIPSEIRQIVKGDHPQNVVFAGYMTGDVYEGAFSGADAFFFPSYEENEGIVILEALASEQATIVRDIPVYSSWLVDKVNCRKGNNNEEFAALIKEVVYGDKALLIKNAHEVAKERSLYNIGIQLKKIYTNVLEKTDSLTKVLTHKPLNIALFSDTYTPDINGVSVSVDTLRKALVRRGHNVMVITPTQDTKITGIISDSGVLRIPGIKLKKLYGYRLSRPFSLKAREILKKYKLDIVHIHTEFSMRIFASAIANNFKVPLVYTYHTMYEDYTHYVTKGHFEKTARRLVAWLSRIASQTCSQIIAPTEKTKHALLGYGINKTINVVPTGIELSSFDKENVSTRDINEFISRYGLENKFRICFLGRLAKEKNVECLIKGFKEVVAFNKNVVFIIAGYGPWEEELKECALKNGVLEYTIFTGSQPHSAVPVVYRSSNVFCSASKTETQGITYIEAMASERPVVAIYDESLEGLLEDGKNGFFFNDENDFAQKIIHLMKMDKENFAEICKNAKEKSKEFSIEKFGESIENVYENAILKLLN